MNCVSSMLARTFIMLSFNLYFSYPCNLQIFAKVKCNETSLFSNIVRHLTKAMVEFLKSCVGTWYKGFFLLLIIEKHTSQIYKRHLEGYVT